MVCRCPETFGTINKCRIAVADNIKQDSSFSYRGGAAGNVRHGNDIQYDIGKD